MKEALSDITLQLRSIWRYRWYMMLVVWVVTIIGWTVVIILPNQYESRAQVFVDTDSLLRPLLKGLAVQTDDVNQRIRLMSKTLLSRPNLVKIARDTDLDIKATTEEQKELLYQSLQKKILLSGVRKQHLYTITYTHADPEKAKAVVQSVLGIFVERSMGNSRTETDAAQRFLAKQIRDYDARLVIAENKLTAFKRKHVDTLPDHGGGIFARMQEAKSQYEQARLEQREARHKRDELRKQYNDALSGESDGSAISIISPTEERILALQKKLDELLLIYTEEYPDVKEIRLKISRLRKQASGDNKRVISGDDDSETNAMLSSLRLSLSNADAELAVITVRTNEYKRRLAEKRKLADTLPQVETEMQRLTRDYTVIQNKYSELLSRSETARMSGDRDETGGNVKFDIIEQPRVPVIPVAPIRPLLSSVVLVAALILGGAFVFLLDKLNSVVLDTTTLRKISGMPVLGSVQRIWTPALRFKRKLEVGAFFTVGIGLIAVFVVVILMNIYGNDLVLIRLIREM